MKKYTLLLFILSNLALLAQFQDSFSDGDFTANPIWTGNTTVFEVNANKQLHLNAPAVTDESHLVTTSVAAVDGYWSFYVDLQFNPSSGNKAYIYLISDQNDLEASLNGYYVLVGNTSDEVSLYKQTGTSTTEIIDGTDGTVATSPKVLVKVTRDLLGNFELFIDTSTTFTNPISEGTSNDNTFMTSSFFGFRCDYTSTRSDKFIFDSITVTTQAFVDVFPPSVSDFELINTNTLQLTFSEELESSIANNVTNYTVTNAIGNPSTATYNNTNNTVLLNFSTNFQANVNYVLTVNNIEDLNTNTLDTTINFSLENAYAFESIIFNEVLADETPSYGLPTFEFIEFKNLTTDTLYTAGWFLSDMTDSTFFGNDTILPNELVLVGKTTAKTFYEGFGKTFGLSSFVSLNKSEEILTLYNQYGDVLDSLHYYDDWFEDTKAPNNDPKVNGGWSLERKADNFPCSAYMNWAPSIANIGGSPGQENTVFQPTGSTAPNIVSATFENDSTINIIFDKEVTNGTDASIYTISIEENSSSISINNVLKTNTLSYAISIDDFYEEGKIYVIHISGLSNCFSAIQTDDSFTIYYVKTPEIGDLIINEILFNPYTAGNDFIEIYNTTNQALNLKGLQIIEYDIDQEDTITDFSTTFESDYILPPNAYFTFSEDTESVFLNYIVNKPEWLIELNIPNFADKEGIAALVLNKTITLDKLHYFSRWNLELLDTENGVSLERISSEGATQDADNWASAAKGFGYGTPTAINSQTFPEIANENLISVSPEVFSPNQDGNKDFALIKYTIDQPGYIANVSVFDIMGRKIKDLALSETIGIEGFWKWDGTNHQGEKSFIGIYIILVDLFDIEGNKKHFEEKIILSF